MKKNLLIWGSALVLLVIAIFVTNGYGKSKTSVSSPDQSITSQAQNQPPSGTDAISSATTTLDKEIDFTLTDLDGNKVSLSDYKGKNVYLNFFATWCPPCRGEMPGMEKMYRKYKDKDLVVLAVDLGEDRDTVKSFIQKNGYSFKVLLDPDQSVGQEYVTSAIPVSVFIDKKGNVVARRVGALNESEMEQYIKMLVNGK